MSSLGRVPSRAVESTPDHLNLVRQARDGDAQALEELLTQVYPSMYRFLWHLCEDAELARDLTQDTMISVARSIISLNDVEAFTPWLYRIARNTRAAHYRWIKARRWLSLDVLFERVGSDRWFSDSQSEVESVGEAEIIRHTLAGLSMASREVLYLRHVAGYTGPEIASILEISRAAAKQRLSRAERAFRHRYQALTPTTDLRVHEADV